MLLEILLGNEILQLSDMQMFNCILKLFITKNNNRIFIATREPTSPVSGDTGMSTALR